MAHIPTTGRKDELVAVAGDYVRQLRRNSRRNWANEVERYFKVEILPAWKGKLVTDIGRRDVLELSSAIVDRGAPVTANRCFAAARGFFNWCIKRDIIDRSPCAGLTRPEKEEARDRVLSDDEIKSFWQACGELGYPFGDLAKLLLLTGARLREVADLTWSELDLEKRVWNLPKERSKNHRANTIPLSDAALDLLNSLPRYCDFVFTANGRTAVSGFAIAKKRIDKLMGETQPWLNHDLRRTAASGMARVGIAVHVTEAVLNHRSGTISGVAAVYNRHDYADEKARALEAWARHVMSLVEGAPPNVLTMRKQA